MWLICSRDELAIKNTHIWLTFIYCNTVLVTSASAKSTIPEEHQLSGWEIYLGSWFQSSNLPWWGGQGGAAHGSGSVCWKLLISPWTRKQRSKEESMPGITMKGLPIMNDLCLWAWPYLLKFLLFAKIAQKAYGDIQIQTVTNIYLNVWKFH